MPAPSTSAYLLTTGDQTNLANSSVLEVGPGLSLTPSGVSPNSINTVAYESGTPVAQINALGVDGFLAYQSGTGIVSRTLTAGTGIGVTNTTGAGNPVISVLPNTTVQQVQTRVNGGSITTASILNFIPGNSNIGITTSAGASNTVNVVITPQGTTTGTVTSVGLSTTTGILLGGTNPVTSSGTITVNLDGSGGSNAVVLGDMLVGNEDGQYVGVGVGESPEGYVWTITEGGVPYWAAAPGAEDWWTIPPTSGLNMNNQSIDSANEIECNVIAPNTLLFQGGEGLPDIQVVANAYNGEGSWYLTATGGSLQSETHAIVTAKSNLSVPYGVGFLIGNGVDMDVWGATNPGLGYVISVTDVDPITFDWALPSAGPDWWTVSPTADVDMDGFTFTNLGDLNSDNDISTLGTVTATTFAIDGINPILYAGTPLPTISGGDIVGGGNYVVYCEGEPSAPGQVPTCTAISPNTYAWQAPSGIPLTGLSTIGGSFTNAAIQQTAQILVSFCQGVGGGVPGAPLGAPYAWIATGGVVTFSSTDVGDAGQAVAYAVVSLS